MGQGFGTAWQLGWLGGVSVEAQFFGVHPSSGDTVAVRYWQGVVEWMRAPTPGTLPGLWAARLSKHRSKTPIFLQNGSPTLYDVSLKNVMARAAQNLQFFSMFHNSVLSLQNPSKKIQWSYWMSWPIKILSKWTLQNLQLCLFGSSRIKCLGDGVSCKYKNVPL